MKNDTLVTYVNFACGLLFIAAAWYFVFADAKNTDTRRLNDSKQNTRVDTQTKQSRPDVIMNPGIADRPVEKSNDVDQNLLDTSSKRNQLTPAQKACIEAQTRTKLRVILGPFYDRLKLSLNQIKEFEETMSPRDWNVICILSALSEDTPSDRRYRTLALERINCFVEEFFGATAVPLFTEIIQQKEVYGFLDRFRLSLFDSGMGMTNEMQGLLVDMIKKETRGTMEGRNMDLRTTSWEKVMVEAARYFTTEQMVALRRAWSIYTFDKEYSETADTLSLRPSLHGV
jgi:hypothetical protein